MMIAYEELCQSLDRFNARRRNEAELANLEQVPEQAPGQPEEPPPNAAAVAAAAAAEMMEQEQEEQAASEASQETEGGFAEEPKEDTHEIDVDDVIVDERLSEDKIPGD